MLICPTCGRQLPDGSLFCEQCGSRLVQPQTQPAASNTPNAAGNEAPAAKQSAPATQVPPSPFTPYQPPVQRSAATPGPTSHSAPAASSTPLAAATQVAKTKKPVNKFFILFLAACAVVVVLIGVSVFELFSINGLQADLADRDATISSQNALLDDYETQLADYEGIDANSIEKAEFLDEFIVLIPSGDTHYHSYDCPELADMDTFRAFNIALAEYEGFTPCPTCQ